MTIQQPPGDEMPPMPDADPEPTPRDTTDEQAQRAPGQDHPPMGAPRDEPDPERR